MKKSILSTVLILIFVLSACGGVSQSTTDNPKQNSENRNTQCDEDNSMLGEANSYYYMEEKMLPNPNQAIKTNIPKGGRFYGAAPLLQGETVYRWVYIYDEEGKSCPGYLQFLDLADGDWKNINPSEDFMIDGKQYSGFNAPFIMNNGEIYSRVYIAGDETLYLGRLENGVMDEIICTVPLELIEDEHSYPGTIKLTCNKDGDFFYFHESEDRLFLLDKMLQIQKEKKLPGSILGIAQGVAETDTYWYGTDEVGCVIIGSVSGDEILVKGFDGVGTNYLAECYGDETIFIADKQNIWKVDGEPEVIFNFMANDYLVNEIYSMEAIENGEIRFLVDLDDEYTLLTLKKSETPRTTKKQEIVMAFAMQHLALNKEVVRFNRQSDKYHISVMLPEEGEDWSSFCDRVKLEISAGRGPDILGHDVIMNIAPYVENGYLECLDGMLTDESVYLQAALDGCRIEGKLYGIPYDCTLNYVTYPEVYTEGHTSWTLAEMMKAVCSSDVKILQKGCNGVDIVLNYALYDNSNTAYIDWVKGESHLEEKPFLELLDFAAEYADTGELQGADGDLIQSGEAFAVETTMDSVHWMNALKACFQGEPAIIGYPRAEGNGFYVSSRELYINSNSDCIEGAKEFLTYILSENVQSKYIKYDIYEEISILGAGLSGYKSQLPIHMGAYDALMAMAIDEGEHNGYYVNYGVKYDDMPFTDEQVERFYFLLEHAELDNFNAAAIASIVSEELEPYFAGDVTAEEAAEKLDNRVQLYLDERVYP